jgi:predicted dehydrogenase
MTEELFMKKVRWGLLSTASINRRLIPPIRASQRGELVAVASRSQAAADAYAAEWGIPRAFGSYEAMLSSGEIDAVYVSLPNHLHAEWTIRALDHGLHVLCEKPFALTLAEVDSMTAAAARNGRALAEAFMYRHHPQTKIAGEWVREGKLGDLAVFRGTFSFYMENRENIRMRADDGGGSLWDVGVYPISFAQFLFGGPPEWVVQRHAALPERRDGPDQQWLPDAVVYPRRPDRDEGAAADQPAVHRAGRGPAAPDVRRRA